MEGGFKWDSSRVTSSFLDGQVGVRNIRGEQVLVEGDGWDIQVGLYRRQIATGV